MCIGLDDETFPISYYKQFLVYTTGQKKVYTLDFPIENPIRLTSQKHL